MSGNRFGTLFQYQSFGESHGPAIGCVVDGVPPRIALTEADIQIYLDRRKPGQPARRRGAAARVERHRRRRRRHPRGPDGHPR